MERLIVKIAKMMKLGQVYKPSRKDLFNGGKSEGKPHRTANYYKLRNSRMDRDHHHRDWTY